MEMVRKECSPKTTIRNIKKILKENKLKVKESKVKNIYKNFYSIRLELKGFYNLGTNGKGLSKDLARASAYAELMERIQSKLLINTYFLNLENNLFSFKNEKTMNLIDNNLDDLLATFFDEDVDIVSFLKNNDKYNVIDKYKNLLTNKYSYLPSKLINATSFSNGLCAGNNYYEAVNQGICEIFERYCYREILFNTSKLDNIIIDNTLPIYERIQTIKRKGFNVYIKDCTLDKYPVIGVLITNEDNTKYIFTVGSDVSLNIAIQRCLTEAFQGLSNDKDVIKKMKDYNNNYNSFDKYERKTNWLNNYSSNNGIHPVEMFSSIKEVNYKSVKVFKSINTNKKIYDYLLNIIKINNLNIYIKDLSYLGFNTYKIFIPNLSTIDIINNNEKEIIKEYDFLKNIYFNLDNCNEEDAKKAIKIIKNVLCNKKFSFVSLGSYFHSNSYLKTNYNSITFELFYALLHFKFNIKLNYNHLTSKKLINYLKDLNSDNMYEDIINNLNLALPSCPNCNCCKLRKKCKYKNWKQVNNILNEKEKTFQ